MQISFVLLVANILTNFITTPKTPLIEIVAKILLRFKTVSKANVGWNVHQKSVSL